MLKNYSEQRLHEKHKKIDDVSEFDHLSFEV